MEFTLNDLHLHSALSACCHDENLTPQTMLDYAEAHNYSALCLTDHLWDSAVPGPSDWYAPQNIEHVRSALPLPKPKGSMPFYFGCETELPVTDNADIPWWAENNIKAIYGLGIMKGQLSEYGVSFNPNANINRMELAISLHRLLPQGLEAKPITAKDADSIPFWAEESMRVVCAQGIMNGYPDGTLLPLRNVTRAEASKMLFSIFGA